MKWALRDIECFTDSTVDSILAKDLIDFGPMLGGNGSNKCDTHTHTHTHLGAADSLRFC